MILKGKKEMLDCALVCLQIINLAQEKIATLFDHCKNGLITHATSMILFSH